MNEEDPGRARERERDACTDTLAHLYTCTVEDDNDEENIVSGPVGVASSAGRESRDKGRDKGRDKDSSGTAAERGSGFGR